jgi:hypothetical protein
MKFENLIGQRFTRLTVKARAESNKHGHTKWLCLCDCGKEVIAYASDLKRGGRPSCGCLKSEKLRVARRLSHGTASFNYMYAQYRKNAINRNILFNLTLREFSQLIDKECHYCGQTANLKAFSDERLIEKGINGNFVYTGIDRKNSSLGYVVENCLTCCKTCNFAKNDMPYEEFINYLDRVTKFRIK